MATEYAADRLQRLSLRVIGLSVFGSRIQAKGCFWCFAQFRAQELAQEKAESVPGADLERHANYGCSTVVLIGSPVRR